MVNSRVLSHITGMGYICMTSWPCQPTNGGRCLLVPCPVYLPCLHCNSRPYMGLFSLHCSSLSTWQPRMVSYDICSTINQLFNYTICTCWAFLFFLYMAGFSFFFDCIYGYTHWQSSRFFLADSLVCSPDFLRFSGWVRCSCWDWSSGSLTRECTCCHTRSCWIALLLSVCERERGRGERGGGREGERKKGRKGEVEK